MIKNTGELVQGDVVRCHGALVLIDQEIKISDSHPVAGDGSRCRYTKGLVIYQDETTDSLFSVFVHQDHGRWTIQGNNLAQWGVEE